MSAVDVSDHDWLADDTYTPPEVTRMWVNQPSATLPHHKLHGTRVLAHPEYFGTWRVYFLDGDVVSQQMSQLYLSKGWPQ